MITTLITILIALVLAVGGAGATVAASQDSTPDSPLYAVKLKAEDLRMELAKGEPHQLEVALKHANARINEMVQLGKEGKPVPQDLAYMYQAKMMRAFALAGEMEEPEFSQALAQLRTALQTQTQTMTQLKQGGMELAEPFQTRLQYMLQMCEQTDPQLFRQMLQEMSRQGAADDHVFPVPQPNQAGPQQPDEVPGQGPNEEPGGNMTGDGNGTPQHSNGGDYSGSDNTGSGETGSDSGGNGGGGGKP